MDQQICPVCQSINPPGAFYCSHCGKKLKEPPISTSIGKQLLIYAISFFLPPFGLGWAIKYLKQPSEKAKIIGWVAIILTILSIIVTIWIFAGMMHYYSDILNGAATGTLNIPQNNQMLRQLQNIQ